MGSKRAAASGERGRARGKGVGLAARASKAEMRACTSLIVVGGAWAVDNSLTNARRWLPELAGRPRTPASRGSTAPEKRDTVPCPVAARWRCSSLGRAYLRDVRSLSLLPSSPMATTDDDTQTQLTDATRGFDQLFQNELADARKIFATSDGPFHQLGLGACAFLEAALGMEVCRISQPHLAQKLSFPQTALVTEAQRCLSLSEAGSRKQLKASKNPTTKFPPGTEWELLNSDAVILLGLNHAFRSVPLRCPQPGP